MEQFYFDIVAAADGATLADAARDAIAKSTVLGQTALAWPHSYRPRQSDLYAMIVIGSAGLATDDVARAKVAHAVSGGFPMIPFVDDVRTYDFRNPPIPEITEYNAAGGDDVSRLERSLLHHAGLDLFDGGGQVFISYARSDGKDAANAIRDALRDAGILRTMDEHAFASGEIIQDAIADKIRTADLVVLIDSQGAARSGWVAQEIDIALAAHVLIVAVTPSDGGFLHFAQVPHVEWTAGVAIAASVVAATRRLMGRKLAFRAAVARTLNRLSHLRGWNLVSDGERWVLHVPMRRSLRIGCVADTPRVEDVERLKEVTQPGRGLLVAGRRPLQPLTLRGLQAAGGKSVSVAPLPTMASRVPAGLSARPLRGRRIFLSSSMPTDPDDVDLARATLGPFVVHLAQSLMQLGATLVFGGHPSVTPLVHEALLGLISRHSGRIELHQAERWRASTDSLPAVIRDGPVFKKVSWHGNGADANADVQALRDGMIVAGLDAGVFVGGKTNDFFGARPGIVDEHERFVTACPGKPALVLGLAGGAARTLPSKGSQLESILRSVADPDLAVAIIVSELLGL